MGDTTMKRLEPFIGEWSMEMLMADQEAMPDVGARVSFEWMPGERWLVERWHVPVPEAPDGVAIIGFDEGRRTFLQHYFDQRGIARVYEMTFEEGVWTLERTKADFSPFEFGQRFTGTFSEDGRRIDGTWEIALDLETWEKDFDLSYVRVA